MKFGFIPIEGGSFYDEFLAEVRLGEELGFDSVWLEEHHGVKDHYWPSPMMALAGIATWTEHLLFGTDIMVMPFYHPVRVAEDAAMLQVMSHGRFILGAAIGYKPDEFALYGAEMAMRGARLDESICLIRQLWTQSRVNFAGRYFQVKGLKIEPRPEAQGCPPIWLGGWGERSLTRAAQLGDAWLPGPTADLGKLCAAQMLYQRQLAEAAIETAGRATPLTRELIIASTDAEARRMAEQYLMINYRDEYASREWSHPLIGGEDAAAAATFDHISHDRFLVGAPDTIVREIGRYRAAFGVDHLICRLYYPGLPHEFILNELRLLAAEVMPAFK